MERIQHLEVYWEDPGKSTSNMFHVTSPHVPCAYFWGLRRKGRLRRFAAPYIALVAFGLLLEHADEQVRCQAKDGRQDDMPRVDRIDARDIIRQFQIDGACEQR